MRKEGPENLALTELKAREREGKTTSNLLNELV